MNVCYKREISELYHSMPECNKEYKSQTKLLNKSIPTQHVVLKKYIEDTD